jgi:hypothetical protein
MPRVTVTSGDVTIGLSRAEKLWTLSGDVRIPLDAIVDVAVVTDPLPAVHGLRSPGLSIPGRIKLGTWRSRRGRQFVAVRRGQRAVALTLRNHNFARALVGVDDPEQTCTQIERAR